MLVGALASLVGGIVLFVPKAIGLADNGDGARLVCRLGLTPDYASGQPPFGDAVNFSFVHGAPPEGLICSARSSALVPLRIVAWVTESLPGGHGLDVRVVGVGYLVLFGVAICVLVAALPRHAVIRALTGLALIAVFTDVGYLAYFSTGYAEPLGFVGLLATVGLVIMGWRRSGTVGVGWLVLTTGVMALTVTAKPQYGPIAMVGAVALGATRLAGRGRPWARLVPMGCAVVVLVAGALSVRATPVAFQRANRYNAFFTELLGHAPDPAADVRAFGLPTSLATYAGTTYFRTPNATTDPEYAPVPRKVTYPTMLAFYARRPDRTWHLYARAARAGADPRDVALGMFPYDASSPGRHRTCRWCLTSAVGHRLAPVVPVGGGLLWLGLTAFGVVEVWRRSGDRQALAVGGLVSGTSAALLFATAMFGDGVELTKHLYLADAAFALFVICGGVSIAVAFLERRSRTAVDDRGSASPSPAMPAP